MESLVESIITLPRGIRPRLPAVGHRSHSSSKASYVDRVVSFLGSVLLVTQIPGPQWVDD